MRAAFETIDEAPRAAVGASCEKSGLTLATVDPKLVPGTVELVMHSNLMLMYDKPRWQKDSKSRLDTPTFSHRGPLEKAAADVAYASSHEDKTFDGLSAATMPLD